MKISVSWLKEWIDRIPENLSDHLTMLGLEVDEVSLAAPEFSHVVVGEVVGLSAHPDADKLRVAMVDVGETLPLQIVCGAPNVAVGIKVPVALIGAVLPGDFKIKKSQLRGIDSSGMLCSARELGLNDEHAGLLILDGDFTVGTDFRTLYDLNDQILEIDLTPDRGDCLSILGIARDLALSQGIAIKNHSQAVQAVALEEAKHISVDNENACARYLGRIIKDINPNAKTPLWMSERLRRCGIRPHGILVDITNYVLLELGQPLHAFDAGKLKGKGIKVRNTIAGERFVLLNDESIVLEEGTLVICDDEDIVALAGIMGGKHSACDDKTTDIFLESAWFNPLAIAGKARNYGLSTDASHRFERGVDYNLTESALEYATELFVTLADGKAGPVCTCESPNHLPSEKKIRVAFSKINSLIGKEYPKSQVIRILSQLGRLIEETEQDLLVSIPSYRFDIEIEADLIEEVVRIDGYDNVPTTSMRPCLSMPYLSESKVFLQRFKSVLVDRDYTEVITMSFVNPVWQKILDPGNEPISLKNPISADLSVMRTQLLAGLLGVVDYNLKRQQKRIRVFESGLTFSGPLEHVAQHPHIGGAICGDVVAEQWGEVSRKVDFFDIKGDVEALLLLSGKRHWYKFVATSEFDMLHPGQSAKIVDVDGQAAGYVGKIHPAIAKQLDISSEIYVFELMLQPISKAEIPSFKELSKYPTARRDLALVVPQNITVDEVIATVLDKDHELLYSIELFDIYQGALKEGLGRGIAFNLIFQNEKENLKDKQIDTIMESILNDLRSLGIHRRQ